MAFIRSLLFKSYNTLSRFQKQILLALLDVTLAPIAFMMAMGVLLGTAAEFGRNGPDLLLLAALGGIFSVALKMPQIKLNAYGTHEILRRAIMAGLVATSFALVAIALDMPPSRPAIILFGLFFFLNMVAIRFAMLHGLLWVLGQPQQKVLIYGAGSTGIQLLAALRAHETISPVAYVDDNPAFHALSVGGLRIYGSERIAELAATLGADRVLLAMPSVPTARLRQITRKLQAAGLMVMSIPSFMPLVGGEHLEDVLTLVEPNSFLGRKPVDDDMPLEAPSYQGRVVLVTGAGGSVGAALCRQLLHSKPACIVLFEMSEIALYNIERKLQELAATSPTRIVGVLGSVTDGRVARAVMTEHKVEIVFHAAAYKHVPLVEANPIAGLANNVLGTRILGDAANAAGVKKFVLISTDKAMRPVNVMGASKRLAELVVQDLAKRSQGTVFSIVRFGNVLGSSGSVIPLFKEQIARGGPVTLTHEDVTRYFMTLAEAARLVLLAGSYSNGNGSDIFVLDMGAPVKIRDLARQMIEAGGLSLRDENNPDGDVEIVITGLRPGEKLHEEPLLGEGLLTTPHSKILRAQEHSLTELQMASALRALGRAVASGVEAEAHQVILTFVKDYRPPHQEAVATRGIAKIATNAAVKELDML